MRCKLLSLIPLFMILGCEVQISSSPSTTPPTKGKVVYKDYAAPTDVWVKTTSGLQQLVKTPEIYILTIEGPDSAGRTDKVRLVVTGEVFGRMNVGDEYDSAR